jgi:hypothetical protein
MRKRNAEQYHVTGTNPENVRKASEALNSFFRALKNQRDIVQKVLDSSATAEEKKNIVLEYDKIDPRGSYFKDSKGFDHYTANGIYYKQLSIDTSEYEVTKTTYRSFTRKYKASEKYKTKDIKLDDLSSMYESDVTSLNSSYVPSEIPSSRYINVNNGLNDEIDNSNMGQSDDSLGDFI